MIYRRIWNRKIEFFKPPIRIWQIKFAIFKQSLKVPKMWFFPPSDQIHLCSKSTIGKLFGDICICAFECIDVMTFEHDLSKTFVAF